MCVQDKYKCVCASDPSTSMNACVYLTLKVQMCVCAHRTDANMCACLTYKYKRMCVRMRARAGAVACAGQAEDGGVAAAEVQRRAGGPGRAAGPRRCSSACGTLPVRIHFPDGPHTQAGVHLRVHGRHSELQPPGAGVCVSVCMCVYVCVFGMQAPTALPNRLWYERQLPCTAACNELQTPALCKHVGGRTLTVHWRAASGRQLSWTHKCVLAARLRSTVVLEAFGSRAAVWSGPAALCKREGRLDHTASQLSCPFSRAALCSGTQEARVVQPAGATWWLHLMCT